MLRVLAAARLLTQEMRAPQTNAHLGMTAQPNQLGLGIGRTATPALHRFRRLGPRRSRGSAHQTVLFGSGHLVIVPYRAGARRAARHIAKRATLGASERGPGDGERDRVAVYQPTQTPGGRHRYITIGRGQHIAQRFTAQSVSGRFDDRTSR